MKSFAMFERFYATIIVKMKKKEKCWCAQTFIYSTYCEEKEEYLSERSSEKLLFYVCSFFLL